MSLDLDKSGIAEPVRFLLQKSGATVAGTNAFRLPNGQIFVASVLRKNDAQATRSQLKRLERMLALQVGAQQTQAPQQVKEDQLAVEEGEAAVRGLNERIDDRIKVEEETQHQLVEQAAQREKTANTLKALRTVLADLPDAQDLLLELLTPAIPTPPPPPPPPPQVITDRVQVTRQLVFAATQTIPGEFKVDDLVAVMTQGNTVDEKERLRIRSSIANMLVAMLPRGEVKRVSEGAGRRPATFAKVESKVFTASE